jgi:hypothetical protein
LVSSDAVKIPKGDLTYGYTPLPMHHTHGREGDKAAFFISFQTNINALQEPNAPGSAPHEDQQMRNLLLGRFCICLQRK